VKRWFGGNDDEHTIEAIGGLLIAELMGMIPIGARVRNDETIDVD